MWQAGSMGKEAEIAQTHATICSHYQVLLIKLTLIS